MLCHRCGSQVPENSESCATCGLKLTGGAAGVPRRRAGGVEAPFKVGDVFARRYAIREVLGAGPVGHVFRVLDQEMEVEVALKIINPRLVQMLEERTQFSLALRTGRKLTHPLLVRVYEEGEERGRPYFTTQLLEGMTLRRMMEQRTHQGQHFSPREVEPLLVQLVDALNHAHKYGPHSNLKPENILVLPDLLKVTDYGLALGIPRLPFLQAQKAWRTACYVAPEYSEGGELDTRMDLYTLGVIVGEMLTGQVPEDGEMPDLLFHEPDLPSGMEALYRRATHSNPLARPKSATEFLTEFTSAMSSKPRPAGARPPPGQPAAKPRPKQVPVSLTAELAMAPQLSSRALPPPVPTSELPTLGSPTIQIPVVQEDGEGDEVTQTQTTQTQTTQTQTTPSGVRSKDTLEAPRTTMESPRTTLESPRSTLESPRPQSGDERAAAAPTELITTEQLEQRAAELAREKREDVPVDATQKLDSGALAAIMGTARSNAPAPASKPRAAPAPAPRAEKSAPASSSSSSRTTRTEPTQLPARSSSLGMILLALGGLALGVLGGYWLLKLQRGSSSDAPPAATGAPSPGVPTPSGSQGSLVPGGGCPPGMQLVSGGNFKMGRASSEEGLGDEPVLAERSVNSFCVDEFEYPNRQGTPPKVNVTWEEARAECSRLGKRLCSEAEWEKACKGPGNLRFPYGPKFDTNRCNTQGEGHALAASGAFPGCRSGYQVLDLSGNVAEWTDTVYEPTQERTQKGGSFERQELSVRCASRQHAEPGTRSASVGFRCCMGASP